MKRIVAARNVRASMVVGAWSGLVLWVLLSQVPDVRTQPLSASTPTPVAPVRLLETAGPAPPVYVLSLRVSDTRALLTHDEVRIPVATYGARVRVEYATLTVRGTPCVYLQRGSVTLTDGNSLRLVRQPRCATLATGRRAELALTVTLAERSPINVWTHTTTGNGVAGQIEFVDVNGHGARGGLFGHYVDHLRNTGTRRVDLLNHVWQLSADPLWLWGLIGLAAGLAWLGVRLFPWTGERSGSSLRFRSSAAIGMACLAAGFGLHYAVLVPPLQAADEPDHLLSYARLTGSSALVAATEQLAEVGHFQRLRFHQTERFRPGDIDAPYPVPWDNTVFAEDVATRSSMTAHVWALHNAVLPELAGAQRLLALRLTNVLLFAVAVAVGMATLTSARVMSPQLLVAGFLIIPTLPFFATYVSETAISTSMYLLCACAVMFQFADDGRSHWGGLILGLSAGMVAVSGRSTIPMAPMLTAVLFARMLLGSRRGIDFRDAAWAAGVFWVGLGLGCASTWVMASDTYIAFLLQQGPQTIGSFGAQVWRRPWLVAPVCGCGVLGEVVCWRVRSAVRMHGIASVTRLARLVAYGAALVVGVVLVGSVFLRYPTLPDLHGAYRPPVAEYVAMAVWSMMTDLDYYLWSAFWGGFGWLDVSVDTRLLSGIGVATAASTGILLAMLGRRGDIRRLAWLSLVFVGSIGTLAMYAWASHTAIRLLHGRYLIGFYLAWLPLAWCWPALVDARSTLVRVSLPFVLCATTFALHAYSLRLILERYF